MNIYIPLCIILGDSFIVAFNQKIMFQTKLYYSGILAYILQAADHYYTAAALTRCHTFLVTSGNHRRCRRCDLVPSSDLIAGMMVVSKYSFRRLGPSGRLGNIHGQHSLPADDTV